MISVEDLKLNKKDEEFIDKYIYQSNNEYYDKIWGFDKYSLFDVLGDNIKISDVYEIKSESSLRRADKTSRKNEWLINFYDDYYSSAPCSTREALDRVNCLKDDYKESSQTFPTDELVLARKLPKDKAKKVLDRVKSIFEPILSKVEDENRRIRYEQYLQLKKEFE